MILLVGKNKHSDGDALGHPTVLMKLCSYLNVLCVVLSYDEHLQRSHVVFVITMSCSMLDYMQENIYYLIFDASFSVTCALFLVSFMKLGKLLPHSYTNLNKYMDVQQRYQKMYPFENYI